MTTIQEKQQTRTESVYARGRNSHVRRKGSSTEQENLHGENDLFPLPFTHTTIKIRKADSIIQFQNELKFRICSISFAGVLAEKLAISSTFMRTPSLRRFFPVIWWFTAILRKLNTAWKIRNRCRSFSVSLLTYSKWMTLRGLSPTWDTDTGKNYHIFTQKILI